jgi:hypothetical protein
MRPLALQANNRLLGCHPVFRDPIRQARFDLSAFDPALFEQSLQRDAIVRKLDRVDPAPASKLLHELSFAVIGNE